MFDIAHGLASRVPLTKLAELDGEVYPYLTILVLATLALVGKTLVVTEGM